MATVQAYTKAGVDAKFNSRSNMTLVHAGGGTPDINAFPDAKTGDVIERSSDGARWSVLAKNLNPVEGRVVSVAGKSGSVTLTPSDVGAAPASHTHTKAQITDLNASATATANSIAQRDSGGRLVVGTPTTTTHATTKAYVDSAITGAKAWSNLTGVPSTFTPSAHTHTVSQITDLTLATAATANTTPLRDSAGRFDVANPSTATQVANKGYVDSAVSSGTTWANTSGKPSTFPPSTHTHTKAQITDLNASTAAGANTIAQRDSAGRLTVVAPTLDTQAATKKYVDDTVTAGATWSSLAGKPSTFPPSSHTHTVAQITDLTLSTSATANTVAQRNADGQFALGTPTLAEHAATKGYVDGKTFKVADITDLTILDAATAGSVPVRNANGSITIGEPTNAAHAATRKYVDDRTTAPSWSSITGKPSTFTPSSHTHTVAQITDLTLSTSATANTVAQRDSSGRVTVATPSSTSHATTKAYVDSAVTGAKAWANLTGVPSTFSPSSHSHSTSEVIGLESLISNTQFQSSNISDSIATITGNSGDSGRVLSLSSLGRLTAVDPSATTDVANKRYVDTAVSNGTTWANTSGKPTVFPPSTHTHTKGQITDLNASTSATANSMAQRDSGGRLSVATPTSTTHATTKTYVDNAIVEAKKWTSLTGVPSTFTPSAHTHTMAQITDLPHMTSGASPNALVQRDSKGDITVNLEPSFANSPAPKAYVDNKLPWYGTQTQYDGLTTKDPDRLYIIAYF